MTRQHACYAAYKGDEFLDLGSIPYLAKKFGITEKTIRFYASPSRVKRMSEKGLYILKIADTLDYDENEVEEKSDDDEIIAENIIKFKKRQAEENKEVCQK